MRYYLAVDIGASSGRLILSHMENGCISLEEVHRFENGMVKKNGHLVWEVDRLFNEIVAGMKKCASLGKVPECMGIDTWAVDFVLLDSNDQMIGDAVGYRDSRTQDIDRKVYEIIAEDVLYKRTGIQKQPFNTIYQLMAVKEQNPEQLAKASSMLMIPDYLNFLLTGKKATEYTNASTTQLLNPETKDWDYELIQMLGIKKDIFMEVKKPGTVLGNLSGEIAERVGYDCQVVMPATHDTGAAVMAVPSTADDTLYISSGTWSLMGTELKAANCSAESHKYNFTNEGGYDYRFRYLKNIMGMWMINSARKELAPDESFGAICEMASKQTIPSIVDANDNRFLAPSSMVDEICRACKESNQQIPEGMYEVAAVIYNSLAACYARTVSEIESMTGKKYECIHIIGGGAKASYLNELTAKACKKKVLAGPIEATAIGNIVSQMLAAGEFDSLMDARKCIFNSFPIDEFGIE